MGMVVGAWGITASRNAMKVSAYELLMKSSKIDLAKFPHTAARADPPPRHEGSDIPYKAPCIWSSEDHTWLTLFIYAAAAVVGLVGLISLVVENF